MKLQFSLLSLFVITVYAAVVAAGAANPYSKSGVLFPWLPASVFFLILLPMAFSGGRPRHARYAAFARGAVACVALYMAIVVISRGTPLPQTADGQLPHEIIYRMLPEWPAKPGETLPQAVRARHTRLWGVTLNTALACGLLGGCLALWRFNRLERNAKRTSSPGMGVKDSAE